MEFYEEEQAICPICGCEDLDYGSHYFYDDEISFTWVCPECENSGREVYRLEFLGHLVDEE